MIAQGYIMKKSAMELLEVTYFDSYPVCPGGVGRQAQSSPPYFLVLASGDQV